MKQIPLQNKTVLGIEILLPNVSMYLIVYQNHILCDAKLNQEMIAQHSPTASLMMVEYARCVEDLLENEIIYVSSDAKKLGIERGIRGREALECLG